MVPLNPQLQARLAEPFSIGSVKLQSRVFQSPLSGVTDRAFRHLVRRYAPQSMLYTEMVQASGLIQARSLAKIMEVGTEEQPISIQLFDCRPDFMAEAARMAQAEGAQTIDINMGCPVNKVTRKGGGSSLLRDPRMAIALVQAVAAAVEIPVTVKTRLGWDDREITILDFAQGLQEAGAQMLTLHARTRNQGYRGAARWEWIGRVKAALTIPVIANGDITSVEAAVRCLEMTGADGVMCARGTLGYPFLVGEIDHFLKTGQSHAPIPPLDRLGCAREHLQLLCTHKGDRGLRQARKHLAWYCKGFPGAAPLRNQLVLIQTLQEGLDLLDRACETMAHRTLEPS